MKKLLFTVLAGSMLFAGCVQVSAADSEGNAALASAIQVEEAFARVVEKAKPAVVVITNRQKRSRGFRGMDFQQAEEFFRFFGIPFEDGRRDRRNQDNDDKPTVAGKGSGIIISEDGYILTNYHVIKDADALEVRTFDGAVYDNYKRKEAVEVVGYDEESDLAVLRIPKKKDGAHVKLEFADSDALRVGQWAIAIGAPFDLDYSVTIGCVSQKGRTNMGMSAFDSYIQTDASINPGNSGGPLLDIRGRIIGVNQFIMTGGMSRGSIGLGFAISSNYAKKIADELMDSGTVNRSFIGISMQEIPEEMRRQFDIEHGVLVREVIEGEAAEEAGVKVGDIITEVAGKAVKTSHDLLMEVTKFKPGDKIELGILRDDKKMKITVKAGSRSEYMADGDKGGSRGGRNGNLLKKLGLRLAEREGEVLVADVVDDGAVEEAEDYNEEEIRKGDKLLAINRTSVSSVSDVHNALKNVKGDRVVLYLQRESRRGTYRYLYALKLK